MVTETNIYTKKENDWKMSDHEEDEDGEEGASDFEKEEDVDGDEVGSEEEEGVNEDEDEGGEDEDNEREANAIVALQRATRGRLARQRVKKLKELQELENNIVDVDLEMEISAKKLQKSIRGRLARQKVNKIRQNNVNSDVSTSEITALDGSEHSNDRVRTRANDVYRRLLNRQQIRRNKVDNNTLVSSNESALQDHVDPLKRTNTYHEILESTNEITHNEGNFLLYYDYIRHLSRTSFSIESY